MTEKWGWTITEEYQIMWKKTEKKLEDFNSELNFFKIIIAPLAAIIMKMSDTFSNLL